MDRPKQHLQFLDSFRGIAILSVFLFHCLSAGFGRDSLNWGTWFRSFDDPKPFLALLPFTYGWAGVAVFFVVSGFCIHLSFLRGAAHDWRGFYLRRFFRIYPPYLLAVLFFAFVFPTTRLAFHTLKDWGQLGVHLLLLHNLSYGSFFTINGSFWSIGSEVQLYLIYPLLIALVSRLGWQRALIVVGSLEMVLRGLLSFLPFFTGHQLPALVSQSPFMFWYSWAIGAAVADAYVHERPLPFRSFPATLWLVLAVGAFFVKLLVPYSFPLFALLTATCITKCLQRVQEPAAQEPAATGGLQTPLLAHLRLLGLWSYSFYLFHQPLVRAFPRALRALGVVSLSSLATFALCLCLYPLLLGLAGLCYKYCELPSIALGKRFMRAAPFPNTTK